MNYYNINSIFDFKTPIQLGKLNNKYYILDGQHRRSCIKHLDDMNIYGNFEVFVVIEEYENESEMNNNYIILNKHTAVDLPEDITDWTDFSSGIASFMSNNFALYIRNTKRPLSPYFNIQKFSEYLNNNNVAKRVGMNHVLFIKEINELNNYYRQTYSTSIIPHFKTNVGKYIEQSKQINSTNPCFLSLYRDFEWIEKIIYKINNNHITYGNMIHIDKKHCQNKKITSRMKTNVWRKRFNTMDNNPCPICCNTISWDTFHCGHIVSRFYNGVTDVNNLEPICQKCNLDMGVENLHDYCDRYRRDNM
jgi:hypothetical protein